MNTEDLESTKNDLLAMIRGEDGLGIGIHSYSGRDANNDEIHRRCAALEEEGLICRRIDEPGHVFWVPIKED